MNGYIVNEKYSIRYQFYFKVFERIKLGLLIYIHFRLGEIRKRHDNFSWAFSNILKINQNWNVSN